MTKIINFSKKSWHYKMNWKFRKKSPPRNLCPYVRMTVTTITMLAILFSLCLLEGICTGQFIQLLHSGTTETNTLVGFQIAGVFGLFISCIFACGFTVAAITNKFDGEIGNFVNNAEIATKKAAVKLCDWYEAKEPSLFVEWWRAKHDQLCPAISFQTPPPPPELGDTHTDIHSGEHYWYDGVKWNSDEDKANPFENFEEQVDAEIEKLGLDKK